MKPQAITGSIAAGLTCVALLAACTGSAAKPNNRDSSTSDSPTSAGELGNVVNAGYATPGGTVNVLLSAGYEHLDPVQNYSAIGPSTGRLIYRTLTAIDDTPGRAPTIKPDLAVSLGTPNADKTVWTYHIKKGLKYEDGSPITTKDIKYDIERSFAQDVYKDGPGYMVLTLKNPNHYAGPYKDPNQDLPSVQTPDDYTLILHFKGPEPDTDWMMSEFYSAPVPKAKDDKLNYDFHPVSSGPYKIASYTPNRQLVLVRNPYWSRSTDPLRPALPDKFVITMGISPATISSRLIADEGADQTAVTLDSAGDLQPSDLPSLREPSVRSRFINGRGGPCERYIFFNEQKIRDVNVRKAIATAINRQALLTAFGGPMFGSIPDSFMPDSVRGYQAPNLGLTPTGNPQEAKQILGNVKVPTLHYAISDQKPEQKQVGIEVQNDLKKIGINVVLDSVPTSSYNKVMASDNAPDMGLGSWCSDWSTMAAVVPPVLGTDGSGTKWGPRNFSRYYDPVNSKRINELAVSTQPPSVVDKEYADLANKIMTTNWPLLPVHTPLCPEVVGSKIQNAAISTWWGLINLNIIGVKH